MGLTFGGINAITENLDVYYDSDTIQSSYRTIFNAGTYTYIDIYLIAISLFQSDHISFYTSPDTKFAVVCSGGSPNVFNFGNTPLRIPNTNAIQWRSGGTEQTAYLTLMYKPTG